MLQAAQTESTESCSKVRLLAIPSGEVDRVWRIAEPLLAKATALSPKLETEDIYQHCVLPHGWQLWLAVEDGGPVYAALVTEVISYVSGWRVTRVFACGGSRLFKWRQAVDEEITAYALEEKCDAIEIIGKDFWENVFPDFVEIERIFSKELS